LDANTYSLTHYNEADRVVKEWKDLETQAEKINQLLPAEYRDAFFQLVLHPVKAFANLHELYVSVARNRLNAAKNLPEANAYAQQAKQFYINDSLLTQQYHHIAGGKWNHMMDQTHIGYTYWQQPPVNKMPEVKYVSMETAVDSGFVFNTSAASAKNTIAKNTGNNRFTEQDGVVSMEAEYWTRAVNTQKIKWKVIPDIGRTGSGITTFPVTTSTPLTASGPHVEYDFFTNDSGKLNINLYFSPTLNFHNDEGLKFAVSVDNEEPKTITLNKEDNNVQTWGSWVANNIIIKNSEHTINKPGKHVLKYWMISPAVVLQKLVIDLGGLKPSYLGPPETKMQ
ncbi:MAG: glycosyhydrolase, partial [Flavisolibacter sp.]|nr:glycosyhydrolase [Flavisolibacter sp.]